MTFSMRGGDVYMLTQNAQGFVSMQKIGTVEELDIQYDVPYDQVLTPTEGSTIVDTYPETIGSDKMAVKVEVKASNTGQTVYVNGWKFLEIDGSGYFRSNPDGVTSSKMNWDNTWAGIVKPESDVKTVIVSSQSQVGKKYRLTVVKGTAVACTCEAFQFKGKCKHIDKFNKAA